MQFADFIAPLDPASFRNEYYGRRPVHIPREDRAKPDIFDWAHFNGILAISSYWTEETLKLYFNSRAALRENYCDTAETRAGKAPVNPAKVKALIGVGASVIANHVHHVCPEARTVVSLLEKEFSARSFANVYCSFKGVQAFKTHFDLHDVFVYQAEGEKVWRVYEARAESPVAPLPPGDEAEQWLISTRGALLFETCLRPGDVLYLPRGQYHDALTQDRVSLHVTFGIQPATGLALFKLLENALTQEKQFRDYLPDARDESALREHLARLATRLSAVVTSPAFAIDVLNHQRRLAAREPANYDLPTQETHTWFAIERPAQIVRRDWGYVLAFEGGEIPLGSNQPIVEWMFQQRRFSSSELSAHQARFDRLELSALLARLIEAGIVIEVAVR